METKQNIRPKLNSMLRTTRKVALATSIFASTILTTPTSTHTYDPSQVGAEQLKDHHLSDQIGREAALALVSFSLWNRFLRQPGDKNKQ